MDSNLPFKHASRIGPQTEPRIDGDPGPWLPDPITRLTTILAPVWEVETRARPCAQARQRNSQSAFPFAPSR
jgi:hypothetical protein